MTPIQYRWMPPKEVEKITHIDRTETIRKGYEMRDGQLCGIVVNWDVPNWSKEGVESHSYREQISFCKEHLHKGAKMYGAFDGEKLVGIGIHTPNIHLGMDQLAFLHISHGYRRRGIAKKIASAIEELAVQRGAKQLYVSATPSASAVGFYLQFGFTPIDEPLPELFEIEPEDIHMIKEIKKHLQSIRKKMDSKEYLSKQIEGMRSLQDAALENLNDEQLMVIPDGTVSPIGVIWLHMIYSEDIFIAILMQKPTFWESGGWKERFNLEKAPDFGEDWTVFRDSGLSVDLLRSYTEAVRAETDACLEATTPETLNERVKFFTESDPKADVWVLLSQHSLLHTGEIAALKGLQGLKGLPF